MPRFVARSLMPVAAEALFAWHERPGALQRLLPPWQSVRVEEPGGVRDGDRVVLRMGPGRLALRWVAEHRDYEAGRQFRDVQVSGPFARWVHTHRCLPEGAGSILEDEVDWELPAGSLGAALGGRRVRRTLERMFRFRHARTRQDLLHQATFADRPALRVAVTGATGLVGGALTAFLRTAGHRVHPVTRSPSGPDDIGWSPREGRLDARSLDGVDAVVHLAGENVFGLRWSEAKRRAIRESRVQGTRLLCETLAKLGRPPARLVSASAIGYYGDRGDERLTEQSPPGGGFLAEVCREWEAATRPAQEAGIEVVHVRIGVVLSAAGGALATMLPAFRAGLAGRLGDGRQGFSWIAADDLVYALHFLLRAPRGTLESPVNASAPLPVTNVELTRTLGRVLRRPTLLPVPAAALRGLLGQMAEEMLLASTWVHPERLLGAGFTFAYADLEAALRLELGRLQGLGPAFEHARSPAP